MFDLDKLISEAYGGEAMSFEKLAEMVENMMILQESLGILSEDTGRALPANIPDSQSDAATDGSADWENLRYIPIAQVSELKWGTAATDGAPVDNSAREQLATYLRQIDGKDIAEKVNNLNKFINDAGNASYGIQQALSFLVFYRTLSMIITNFNASAAGFIFESFLAVLLDAENGKQVPASDGETIADLIVYPNNSRLPISLKLYGENSITVGGSFRQIVLDLTTQYPVMQYIVVGKDYTGTKKDKVLNKLNFYGFNFTLDNLPTVINYLGEGHAGDLLQLPKAIVDNWEGKVTRAFKKLLTDADKKIDIEGGAWEEKEIEISDNMSGFKDDKGNPITGMKYQQIDFKIPRGNRVSPVFGYRAMREAAVQYIKDRIYLPSVGDPNTYEKLENILDESDIEKIRSYFDKGMAGKFIVDGKDALVAPDASDKYNINNVTAEFGMVSGTEEEPKFMFMSGKGAITNTVLRAIQVNVIGDISKKVQERYEELIKNIKNQKEDGGSSINELEAALVAAKNDLPALRAKIPTGPGSQSTQQFVDWKNKSQQIINLTAELKKKKAVVADDLKKYNNYKKTNIVFVGEDATKTSEALKKSIFNSLKEATGEGVKVNKEKMEETGGVSPRTKKIDQIWGSEGKADSLKILRQMAKSKDVEAYKILLRLTKGYNLSRQFDITRAKFESLMKSEALDARYLPYGNAMDKGAFAILDIGETKVMEVTNKAFTNINENMKTIFKNLYFLQKNINTFVAGGMNVTKPAEEAKVNANTISTNTQAVIDEKKPTPSPEETE